MGKYRKLFQNTIVLTIGQMSGRLLGFLLIPLYTSVLATSEYGTYDIIVTTVTLLSPLLTLVISEATLRFCIDKEYENSDVFTFSILITLAGSCVLIVLMPLAAQVEALRQYYLWIVVFFITTNIQSVLLQYLKGIGSVVEYTIMGFAGCVLTLVSNIVFLLVFQWGIQGYLMATALSHTVIVISIFFRNRMWKKLKNPLLLDRNICRQMLAFSMPMIPNSISWWVSNSSDKYMLMYFVSASAVGIYSVGYKIPTILTLFVSMFVAAFQLSIFEVFGEKHDQHFYVNTYRMTSAMLFPMASVLIFSSKYLAYILYQNAFYESWKVGCILILSFVFNSLSSLLGTLYTAEKKTLFLLISTSAAAVINIVLNLLTIPHWGFYGAAIATLISYMSVWLLRIWHQKQTRKIFVVNITTLVSISLVVIQAFVELKYGVNQVLLSASITMLVVCIAVVELNRIGLFKVLANRQRMKER